MPYVITNDCIKDLLCVDECATGAIHPTRDEAALDMVPQLYINPDECLECGSCAFVCPSDAIDIADNLPPKKQHFVEENAAFYSRVSG